MASKPRRKPQGTHTQNKPVQETDEMPFAYLQSASQILEEKGGVSKLRVRNDMIRGDLVDLAQRTNSRVASRKHGNQTYHVLPQLGITVCLING